MYKVIIFGTGESAEKALTAINLNNTAIEAFSDNSFKKQGTYFCNKLVIAPDNISTRNYDYIIIAIIKYHEVIQQLVSLGIDNSKLIPYFNIDIIYKSYVNEIFWSHILLKDNYDLKINTLKGIVENLPYELYSQLNHETIVLPNIKSIDETINEIIENKVSISRYGDGEFKLIAGIKLGFQNTEPKLAERLKEILKSDLDKHIVGLFNVYGDLSKYTTDAQEYLRQFFYRYKREFQYSLLDMEKVYYDAFITRPYIIFQCKDNAPRHFKMIKSIWENREIVIIEGDRTRLGVGNDLFDNICNCQRIICPNENAFSVYDQILEAAKSVSKEKLILIALGPTATVLAYDLAKEGFQAIDIGHIDVEYEWYLMGATEKVTLKNKYTNEAYGGNAELVFNDEIYNKQIIHKIHY
jgi:glycosyltransferase family protein